MDDLWMTERKERDANATGLGAPIFLQSDSNTTSVLAAFVANRGKDEDAAKHVSVNFAWLTSDLESPPPFPPSHPAPESQRNVMIKRAVRDVQEHIRVMESSLEH